MNYEMLVGLLGAFHKARVLVMGDVMLDRFIYGSVERISPEAPIPVMSVTRTVDMPGGAGNVVRNVAAMGGQAILLGVVGDDEWAFDLRRQFARMPTVDVRLVTDTGRPTTVKTRYVAERQQVLRADRESRVPVAPAIAEKLLVEFERALNEIDVVILSDYAKGSLSDEVTRSAIAAARRASKRVVVDPKSRDFSKYAGATVLTPNRNELQLASGFDCITDEQVIVGARLSVDAGICEAMVVTRSADGMTVVNSDTVVHLHTIAKEVFDVSGAGDTALAALSLGLAAGGQLVDVARIANLAAGIVVGKPGTAVVSTGEIMTGLDSLAEPGESPKVFGFSRVLQRVESWREQGLKIAFTNGCFDLLHPGHVSLLDQARRSADKLVVGLNSDMSVRRLKGAGRPVQSEVARATVLSSLKAVDAVVIFDEETPLEIIKALAPDVLVKGADYTIATVVGADEVIARGGKVLLANLVDGQSTTNTLRRVAGAEKA